MNNIMVNLNTPVALNSIRDYIALSPIGSVTKFAVGEFRHTIEHSAVNRWTIVTENIARETFVEFEQDIETLELAEILNAYL